MNLGFCQGLLNATAQGKLTDLAPLTGKGLLDLSTTLSYATSSVVRELHKQPVRRACWRWCFSRQHRPAARQPVPREGESTPCPPPKSGLGGSLPLGSRHGSTGPASPACQQHRKQRALLVHMSPCGFWSRSHPAFKPAQADRAAGNGQGCIYSHMVFIQRCCFAQITMNFFMGRGHSTCLFCGASRVHVTLISLPEKEEGQDAFRLLHL